MQCNAIQHNTLQHNTIQYNTIKEGVLCSVIEHDVMSLSFQTSIQKNEEKLTSYVQFENEMTSYRALSLNKAQLSMF